MWYQYFLGVRPDLARGRLTLAPRLPAAVPDLDCQVQLGPGQLAAHYQVGATATYTYTFHRLVATVTLDLFLFAPQQVADGTTLKLTASARQLTLRVTNAQGRVTLTRTVPADASRLVEQR